jgi:exosome complex RNA-binding protein Csl4
MTYEPRKPARLVERQPAEKAKAEVKEAEDINTHGRTLATCPECRGKLVHEGGCSSCPACGWSACGV